MVTPLWCWRCFVGVCKAHFDKLLNSPAIFICLIGYQCIKKAVTKWLENEIAFLKTERPTSLLNRRLTNTHIRTYPYLEHGGQEETVEQSWSSVVKKKQLSKAQPKPVQTTHSNEPKTAHSNESKIAHSN